jgi:hypothetical protein
MSLSFTMIPGMLICLGVGAGAEGFGAAGSGSFLHFCVRRGEGGGEGIRFVPSILRFGGGVGFGSFVHFCVRRGAGGGEGIWFVPSILRGGGAVGFGSFVQFRLRRNGRGGEGIWFVPPFLRCEGGRRSFRVGTLSEVVWGRAARAFGGFRASRFWPVGVGDEF